MAKNRKGLPLHSPDDPAELFQNLQKLEEMNFKIRRTSKYQIKVGKWNYYWTTGRIMMDGCEEVIGKGFEELLLLLGKGLQ